MKEYLKQNEVKTFHDRYNVKRKARRKGNVLQSIKLYS